MKKRKSSQSILDIFSRERIENGEVTDEETANLAEKVMRLYIEMAAETNRDIIALTDAKEYEQLKENKLLYDDPNNFYLLIDPETEQVLDMEPAVYHTIETPEGLAYSRIMQLSSQYQL